MPVLRWSTEARSIVRRACGQAPSANSARASHALAHNEIR